MLSEVLAALAPKRGGRFIDATLGDGGHAMALLRATSPNGRLLGIERDRQMAERAKRRLHAFRDRLVIVHGSYENLERHARVRHFLGVDGVLFDLGVASWHFDASRRGFSFRRDAPLDMRFDPSSGGATAADLLNRSSRRALIAIFRDFGEVAHPERIADAVLAHRPFRTTRELAECMMEITRHRRGRSHPATKVFQALRIAVNDELRALAVALPQARKVLRRGGVLAVISYHSLEDRIVKRFFREGAAAGSLMLPMAKPIRPERSEVLRNPRVRSAKLRVAIRIV